MLIVFNGSWAIVANLTVTYVGRVLLLAYMQLPFGVCTS